MQLTFHADFALRVLVYLAVRGGEPVSVETVAKTYGISTNHLAKVAQHLVRLGWVASARGRHGGLTLDDAVWEIPLGVMLKELESRWDLVECFGSDSRCPIEPSCGLKSVLHEAQRAFFAVLDRYTLRDVVTDRGRLVSLLLVPPPDPGESPPGEAREGAESAGPPHGGPAVEFPHSHADGPSPG